MKKAAVLIDSWKLPAFESRLKASGFTFSVGRGLTDDTRILTVECTSAEELAPTIEAAQADCAGKLKSQSVQ